MPQDVLSLQWMLAAVREIEIPRGYIAQNYLPLQSVLYDELTWDIIKDENQLAGVYGIDGQILPGDDPIFSQAISDVFRIGASRIIPESAVRTLRDPGMLQVQGPGMVRDIRAKAEEDVARRLAAANGEVDATMEYLGMRALMGSIPWPPPEFGNPPGPRFERAKFTVDLGLKHKFDADAGISFNGQTLGTGYYWTDLTNSDPLKDLMGILTVMREEAGVATGQYDLVLSEIWRYWLLQNATLRDLLKQSENAPRLLRWTDVDTLFRDTLGWGFSFYDGQYTTRTVSTSDPSNVTIHRHRILPSNKVLLVPTGVQVGDFATSPAKPNGWQTGKFTWREENTNPWTTEVGVGINAFPRITLPDTLGVLTIAADGWNPSNITY